MDYKYRYNWQGDTQLGFNSPLVVGMKFADLKTGQVYQILSIGGAGPAERVGLNPPEGLVRTADPKSRPELGCATTGGSLPPQLAPIL